MHKLKAKLTNLIQSIPGLVRRIPELPHALLVLGKELVSFSLFVFLVLVYLFRSTIIFFGRFKLLKKIFGPVLRPLDRVYLKIVQQFEIHDHDSINSLDIINLAASHLMAKRSRTMIAIGGMAIGFGAVVFLLSIGYGAEKLVVSRVARLDELKQADVTAGKATSLAITDKVLVDFNNIDHVQMVLPMISVVSKVSYNNSVSDVVAYAVSSEFLKQSAIRPTKGKIFDSPMPSLSELLKNYSASSSGKVAGAEVVNVANVKAGQSICQTQFKLNPLIWKPVYQSASTKSKIVGYTKRETEEQTGEEVWGESYEDDPEGQIGIDDKGNHYGRWVSSTFLLWEKKDCNLEEPDCVDGRFVRKKENNRQSMVDGYLTKSDLVSQCFKVIDVGVAVAGEKIVQAEVRTKGQFVPIFQSADSTKTAVGYTQVSQFRSLPVVWGASYPSKNNWGRAGKNNNNQPMGYWVKGEFKLWRKLDCTDCDQQYLTQVDEKGNQTSISGYLRLVDVELEDESVLPSSQGKVLGVSTTASNSVSTASASSSASLTTSTKDASASGQTDDNLGVVETEVGWVEIASVSADTNQKTTIDKVKLPDDAKRQAVINKSMIKLLGLNESEAIGKTFEASFVLNENLFSGKGKQRESEPAEYTIIGIIPGDKTPAFYLPFNDLKGTGVESYPQVKIVVDKKTTLGKVRDKIEGLGFKTTSAIDTVDRINNLFGNIRLVLSFLGMIALGVAALGMFNTLTVSLLERTREVGLMKAMGMSTHEVKRLFLTESVIMGVVGGVLGLLFGALLGKVASLLISTISLTKGLGFLNVTYIPISLVATIMVLSFIIGIFTGFFPARRATKISALDALRYE